MNIYIYNLDRSTEEEELRELFEEFGEVDTVLKNSEPDPEKDTFSAVVNMPFKDEAEEAISELHGEFIDGREVRVRAMPDAKIEESRTEDDSDEAQKWTFD